MHIPKLVDELRSKKLWPGVSKIMEFKGYFRINPYAHIIAHQ
jgi:hypothetical protein